MWYPPTPDLHHPVISWLTAIDTIDSKLLGIQIPSWWQHSGISLLRPCSKRWPTTGASDASHLGNCCPSAYSSRVSYVKKRQVWKSRSETDWPHLEITPDFSTEKNRSILKLADVRKNKPPNHGASRDLLRADRQWDVWNFRKPAKIITFQAADLLPLWNGSSYFNGIWKRNLLSTCGC